MHVTLVHVRVKPEHVEAFIEATRANQERSVTEEGNLRFDVLRSVEEPTRFVLYEAYADEAGAGAHKRRDHYAAWRDAVSGMMAEPRIGVRYEGFLPPAGTPPDR